MSRRVSGESRVTTPLGAAAALAGGGSSLEGLLTSRSDSWSRGGRLVRRDRVVYTRGGRRIRTRVCRADSAYA